MLSAPPPIEEIRWLANRGRFDTASENSARGTAYSDVAASLGPLAPHTSLTTAARRHSEDMAKNDVFQHDTVPGIAYYDPVTQPKPWDRMKAEGFAYHGATENISTGSLVEVRLANDMSSPQQLAVPRDYQTLAFLRLEAGEEGSLGTFVKSAGTGNVGFRNLTPPSSPDPATVLALTRAAPGMLLRWPSQRPVLSASGHHRFSGVD